MSHPRMGTDHVYDPGADVGGRLSGAGGGALLRRPRGGHRTEADRLSDRALLAIGPVLVLGLLASLFHLGNPLNAYRAVGNLRHLLAEPRDFEFRNRSRLVGALFALMQWRKIGTFACADCRGRPGRPDRAGAGLLHEPGLPATDPAGVGQPGHADLVLYHDACCWAHW